VAVPLVYDYKVRDQQGQLVEGALEGDSIDLIARRLREMGYLPVSVKPRAKRGFKWNWNIQIPGLTRIKTSELAVATRQLASMVDSGLSLVRALDVMVSQVENIQLAGIFREVQTDVGRGLALHQALSRHPKVFDNLYVSMVQAGEAGGTLDMVLVQLATLLEKKAAIIRRVRSAMTYPAVVATVMIVIFLAMITFIVPIFKKIFASLGGAKLPLPTRIVLKISSILLSPWALLVLAVIIVAILIFLRWKRTLSGRRAWDGFKLRFPVFGPLMHKVAISRFASSFASLLASGVPMLQSLDMTAEASGNQAVADVLIEAKEAVRQGRSIAEPFARHDGLIPNLVTQMVEVGERAGSLDAMLLKVAEFYDQEVEETVNSLSSLLEPMLTVVMGIMVGVMVVSLYLPMFDYVKHVPTS
jgi:type IV pilus assembly protein PilC